MSTTDTSTLVEPSKTDSNKDVPSKDKLPNPSKGKVVPVGTFMNIASYFGSFFIFVFFLFIIIRVVAGGKGSANASA
jgi:hypothetical protein